LVPSTGLPIEQQFVRSLIMTESLRSNSAITGYQLAFGNTDAALRLIPARNGFNSRPYLTCTSATLGQVGVTNSSLSLRSTSKTHPLQPTFECKIVKGVEQWFLTDDTNDPDEPDTTTQLDWFQVIKGYLPQQWSITQALFFRTQRLDAKYYTGERWKGHLITFFWTQSH
jgi:hypothetical protein